MYGWYFWQLCIARIPRRLFENPGVYETTRLFGTWRLIEVLRTPNDIYWENNLQTEACNTTNKVYGLETLLKFGKPVFCMERFLKL